MSFTPLAGRGMIGGALGRGYRRAAAAEPWWLAGGVAAANCVAAYQPKGAASLEASYVNLASPGTYNAAPGVAPTWDATSGWIFNGSTTYLDSGFVVGNNWTVLVRFSDLIVGATNQPLVGSRSSSTGTNGMIIWPVIPPDLRFLDYGTRVQIKPYITVGVMGFRGNQPTQDGNDIGATTAGTHTNTLNTFIGANNNGGSAAGFLNGKEQALVFYNLQLSQAQVSAIYTAMAAL